MNKLVNRIMKKRIRIMPHKITRILAIFSLILVSTCYSLAFALNTEYLGLIYQKISTHFIYPQEAQAKGWEGIAKVRFTLTQDGRIKEIAITQSSGYPLLDAAAILAIKDASPYPLPESYTKKELEITVPISYKQDMPLETNNLQNAAPLQQAAKAKPIKSPKTTEEKPLGYKAELSHFLDLGIKNNQPLQVSRQEIELAQFKIMEAQRNLFPALKISGYKTTGELNTLKYEEWEPKVEVSQPLFHGGQLVEAVKQSGVELEINKKNYDRLKVELMQKTETAYYNLAVAKIHLKLKEALLQEAKEMLEKIEKLSALGMLIPLEANGARAWFDQIQFQLDSIKREMQMAELAFEQVLNIKEPPEIQTTQPLEQKKLNIDLPTCIEMALKKNPEIQLSGLLIKYNDYNQKIKHSEVNAFTVDLISSYGYYKGHSGGNPWSLTNNWFAGVKVSKPWGGNTFNSSYTDAKVRPPFGQSAPSRYSTSSADLSILDNLKRLSEKKKADIDMQRSLSDFNETKKTITFQTKDAFFNYEKAILQLNSSEAEMKFRRNETDVIKMRAMVGETNLSSAMESIYNLSEAQVKYIQALANYQASLANLKKATGYGLQI